jgi:hypothetical protein
VWVVRPFDRRDLTQAITAPISDNQTWAQCRRCGRGYRVQPPVPGVLHVSVGDCARCHNVKEPPVQISGTFPALNTPRKPSRSPKLPKGPKPPKK